MTQTEFEINFMVHESWTLCLRKSEIISVKMSFPEKYSSQLGLIPK